MNPTPTTPPAGNPKEGAPKPPPNPENKAAASPSPATPQTEAAKPGVSFWEKMGQKQSTLTDASKTVKKSLVNAIVNQAEKAVSAKTTTAGKPQSQTSSTATTASGPDKSQEAEEANRNREEARSLYTLAKDLLTLVIVISLGAWLFFYASLDETNYLHSKFDKQNIATQLNSKNELLQQLKRDVVDVRKFGELLRVENLANEIVELDLENRILNWQKPEGEQTHARPGAGRPAVLYKVVEEDGSIVYYSEKQILEQEEAKARNLEIAKSKMAQIASEAEELKKNKIAETKVKDNLTNLLKVIENINFEEKNFPSATTKQRFSAAKKIAHNIILNVKSINLDNLVADIKKQAQAIDVSDADEGTREVVQSLQGIINRISAKQPSSFEKAIRETSALNFAKINDNEIYKKVALLTNGMGEDEEEGDLKDAFTIAKNLGTVNIINTLRANRRKWSIVIENVDKVTRYGADMEKDIPGEVPKDARKDIDPNGDLMEFTSYSLQGGKDDKGDKISITGEGVGAEKYTNKNFSLVADLVDALEGSKYFQDVEGYSYTRTEDKDSGYYKSPLSFNFILQDPTQRHPLDVGGLSFDEEEDDMNSEEEISLDFLDDLDFLKEEKSAAPMENDNYEEDTSGMKTEDATMDYDPFVEINGILNPIK